MVSLCTDDLLDDKYIGGRKKEKNSGGGGGGRSGGGRVFIISVSCFSVCVGFIVRNKLWTLIDFRDKYKIGPYSLRENQISL